MSWIQDYLLKEAFDQYTLAAPDPPNEIRLAMIRRGASFWRKDVPYILAALFMRHTPQPDYPVDLSKSYEVWGWTADRVGADVSVYPPGHAQLIGLFDATCTASIIYFPFVYSPDNSPISLAGEDARGNRVCLVTKHGLVVGGVSLPSLFCEISPTTLV